MVHVRFDGKSHDLDEASIGLLEGAREDDVRAAVARYLEVDRSRMEDLVVERTSRGDILVRPEAVFG